MSTKNEPLTPTLSQSRRNLLLRDGLVFFALTCITLLLYALTLLLFRSFERHRASLAIYWSDLGKDEMAHGHAAEGAVSLRNALSYAPDNRSYESLLAQALSASGQTDQAMTYFLNLWESQPGDGFINLELGRLSRTKGLTQQAVNYYHASIFGDWRGDGPTRRRSVRLELADYLISIHDTTAARTELLIASGNAPDNEDLNMVLGNKFAAIGDAPEALNSYKKALVDDPRKQAALEAAGQLSLQLGDYAAAHAFLEKDLNEGVKDPQRREQLLTAATEAKRLEELSFSPNLPSRERGEHLVLGRAIARARFAACSVQLGGAVQQPAAMMDLKARWKSAETIRPLALEEDEASQEIQVALIRDTEIVTSKLCGIPSGDDAILLRLANPPKPNQ